MCVIVNEYEQKQKMRNNETRRRQPQKAHTHTHSHKDENDFCVCASRVDCRSMVVVWKQAKITEPSPSYMEYSDDKSTNSTEVPVCVYVNLLLIPCNFSFGGAKFSLPVSFIAVAFIHSRVRSHPIFDNNNSWRTKQKQKLKRKRKHNKF